MPSLSGNFETFSEKRNSFAAPKQTQLEATSCLLQGVLGNKAKRLIPVFFFLSGNYHSAWGYNFRYSIAPTKHFIVHMYGKNFPCQQQSDMLSGSWPIVRQVPSFINIIKLLAISLSSYRLCFIYSGGSRISYLVPTLFGERTVSVFQKTRNLEIEKILA